MKHSTKYFLKRLNFIGIFILLLSINNCVGQTKVEQLDELLNLYTEYGQFNGSVLVVEKGEIIYKKGFGLANMEWNIQNQSDTKFRIGSITKQFTSMLIMQLVEEGKLELHTPISKYLPDYPKSNGNKITIHHLLTHSSGIPDYPSFPGVEGDINLHPYTPQEFTTVFSDSTLQFTPGAKFAYSNSGYFLLGVLIEKVSGKSYEQILKENITIPLKMNDTGYDHHGTVLTNRASGYEKNGSNYINAPYLDMSIPYAAGCLYSTVEDMYLWDKALYTSQLLPKESMDLLFSNHIEVGSSHYGYGWFMGNETIGKSNNSIHTISHGGGINGFNTLISRTPSNKNMVVIFNNTGRIPIYDINTSISGILYGESYELPKKSLANSLFETMNDKGIAEGVDHFNTFKNHESYLLNEGEMNNTGYRFLLSGKVAEAIEVFKINVSAFPESGNVYDSLGEAYLEAGKKELAIKNYRKSIEIDSKNVNGAKILEKLLSGN